MYTVLIVVTAVALAVATGLAIVVARLLREDRERSDARVATLALIAGETTGGDDSGTFPATRALLSVEGRGAESLPDLDLRTASPDANPSLFAERDVASPWGRRAAVMGTLAALLGAVLLAATLGGHSGGAPTPAPAAAAPTASSVPLELVALRHVRGAQNLTISGVVRNPRGAAPVARLVATAFVFGPDGAFLTSSRAPIRLTSLAAGEESPFAVSVPVNGEVSRYRIGFRSEDGRVVAHVDKRTTETLASKQEQP